MRGDSACERSSDRAVALEVARARSMKAARCAQAPGAPANPPRVAAPHRSLPPGALRVERRPDPVRVLVARDDESGAVTSCRSKRL